MFVALAAGLVTHSASAGEAKVSGKGSMWAKGVGTIHAVGSGHTVFKCLGTGVVKIRDYKNADINLSGEYEKKIVGGTLIIYNLKGRVSVKSETLNVLFVGGRVHFSAKGKGTVYLKGHGKYGTGHGPKDWAEKGEKVQLQSDPAKSGCNKPSIETKKFNDANPLDRWRDRKRR